MGGRFRQSGLSTSAQYSLRRFCGNDAEDDSTISINAYQIEDYVYIEVCDNGSGIEDKDKDKIFEKFYTVNHSIVDSKKSMGLGLALCKSIVEAHGGVISVKDNHPTGAIFTFSLPATKITINKDIIVR